MCFSDQFFQKSGCPLRRLFSGGREWPARPSLRAIAPEHEDRTTAPRSSREIATRPLPSEGGAMATHSWRIPAPPLTIHPYPTHGRAGCPTALTRKRAPPTDCTVSAAGAFQAGFFSMKGTGQKVRQIASGVSGFWLILNIGTFLPRSSDWLACEFNTSG